MKYQISTQTVHNPGIKEMRMNHRDEKAILSEILERVREIYYLRQKNKTFEKGKSKVHYAGRVFDEDEMVAATESTLEFWLTLGKHAEAFENEFANFLGTKHTLVVNSGSSANLIAVSVLCSPYVKNHMKPGDEVITPALAFPTTLAPIIQNGLIPVFVDVEEDTYNIDPDALEKAVSEKTRAVIFAHTLGNPADMDKIMKTVRKHNLFLIEDNCDALDSRYDNKITGSFGDISTYSFYAAHHITMGEGGAVATDNLEIYRNALSIRDWGRACWCRTGENKPFGACGKRFEFQFEGLPEGFDHKYTYTNIGYNLKPIDIQCAIGREQLKKLPDFTRRRKENFAKLYQIFKKYEDYFILPRAYEKSDPSWFAIPITVKENSPFKRNDFVKYLEGKNIETRMLFGGNILKHPGYKNIQKRIAGSLENSDRVMYNSFFLGVFPGLTDEMIAYVGECIDKFFD
jgi:CDP-6-deoxy-D-xylo-4-hexulose-3-dehydrase